MQRNVFMTILAAMFSILLITSSCASSQTQQEDPVEATASSVSTPTLAMVPVTEVTATPSCRSSITRLNDLTKGRQIDHYQLSNDAQYVYFQAGVDWWKYSIKSRQLTPVSNVEATATHSPFAVEETYRSILGENYDLLHDASSLSPQRTMLIYWNTPDHLKVPTSTSDPNAQANESFKSSQNDMFLLQEGEANPVHIGTIPGGITKVHWIPSKDQAVLEMLALSPYYLWLLDVPTRTLAPLLSRAEVSGAPKFAVLDISPDGNQIMYQTSLVDHLFIKSIDDSTIQPIYAIPRGIGAWWLPNGKRIVTVVDAGPGYDAVYLYNLQSNEMTRIAADLPSGGTASFLGASGTEVILAYVKIQRSGSQEIKILNLCLDIGK